MRPTRLLACALLLAVPALAPAQPAERPEVTAAAARTQPATGRPTA